MSERVARVMAAKLNPNTSRLVYTCLSTISGIEFYEVASATYVREMLSRADGDPGSFDDAALDFAHGASGGSKAASSHELA